MVELLEQTPLLDDIGGGAALDTAGLVDVLERIQVAGLLVLDDAHAAVRALADGAEELKVEEVDVAVEIGGAFADAAAAEGGSQESEHGAQVVRASKHFEERMQRRYMHSAVVGV